MKKLPKKIHIARGKRSSAGFTLAETVITIALIVLITAAIALGTTAAIASYRKMVLASESQVLLDTALNAVSDELRYAMDARIEKNAADEDELVYTSAYYGANCKLQVNADDGQLEIVSGADTYKLLGQKTYTSNLKLTLALDTADIESGIVRATIQVLDPMDATTIVDGSVTVPQANR